MDESIEKLKKLRDEIQRSLQRVEPNDKVVPFLSADERARRQELLENLEARLREFGVSDK